MNRRGFFGVVGAAFAALLGAGRREVVTHDTFSVGNLAKVNPYIDPGYLADANLHAKVFVKDEVHLDGGHEEWGMAVGPDLQGGAPYVAVHSGDVQFLDDCGWRPLTPAEAQLWDENPFVRVA